MTGDWETTEGKIEDGCKANPTHIEQEARLQVSVCSSVSSFYDLFFFFLTWNQMRHYTDLPVGALSPHCIFPVRNDVGSVVLDDVVVILSIWGKGLGGTGHLGLWNVEQILCSRSGQEKRRQRGRCERLESAAPPGLFPSVSLFFTNLCPNDVAAPWITWLTGDCPFLIMGYFSTPNYIDRLLKKKTLLPLRSMRDA